MTSSELLALREGDLPVRAAVYRLADRQGPLPGVDDLARELDRPASAVKEALQRLDAHRLLVVDDESFVIQMAHPLAGFESAHHFVTDGRRYDANCAWDVLALPPLLEKAGTIHSRWSEDEAAWQAEANAETFHGPEGIIHFAVPAERFWDDIGST